MAYRLDDTIAAVASPPGGAARGIVRTSGAGVAECLAKVFRPASGADVRSLVERTVLAGTVPLRDGAAELPCEVYFWPTGRSFTGEPAAEIHTFGSPPLLQAVIKALAAAGARPAEPGEFTLRAFLNGRLDLTQAEAVLGAVDAGDPAEFDVALAQLAGGLAGPLGKLRDELLNLLAHLEAGFDFADEDLPFITRREIDEGLAAASAVVADLAGRMDARHATGELPRMVLVGWPNVGKSSLFNALLGKTGALVSDLPATTRDYLTAEIDLHGVRCLLVDTAGVEIDPAGPAAAIRQAAQAGSAGQARGADVEILCLDASRPLNGWERAQLAAGAGSRLVVLTKTDRAAETDFAGPAIPTSSAAGRGLAELRGQLRAAAISARLSGGRVVAATAIRCHESLRRAGASLGLAREILAAGDGEELVAAEIRTALEALGMVVGATCTDDLLDRIFSRFCIGK
jgi:tRNA modification GTPase